MLAGEAGRTTTYLPARGIDDVLGIGWDTRERATGFKNPTDGKVIYRKKFEIAALPDTTTLNTAHGIADLNVAELGHFRIWGVVQDDTNVTPFEYITNITDFTVDATNIDITTDADLSGSAAVVYLEYTKT